MAYEIVHIGKVYFITSDEKCKRGDRVLWGRSGFRRIIGKVCIKGGAFIIGRGRAY